MRKLRPSTLLTVLLLAACGDDATGPAPIAEIEIAAGSDVLVVGRSMAFGVAAFSAAGDTVPSPTATWSSSDSAVADVSAAGVVTGVGEGEAVIMATAEGHEATLAVRVAPDSVPLFTSPPFEDEYDLWNAFDHDVPRWSGDPGQILTWRGYNVSGLEGHDGYDWKMPEGTPLFAVGDGVVKYARGEEPWSCPLRNDELVSALYVVILHTAAGGERFLSQYLHLNRIDVEAGDTVVAGEQIGLSGNTGCSTGPHLHFEIFREFYQRTPKAGQTKVTDPNGWAGDQDDPWILDDDGAASTYLWAPGSAPPFPLAAIGPTAGPADMHRLPAPSLPATPERR